jgi:hypothetical protein
MHRFLKLYINYCQVKFLLYFNSYYLEFLLFLLLTLSYSFEPLFLLYLTGIGDNFAVLS